MKMVNIVTCKPARMAHLIQRNQSHMTDMMVTMTASQKVKNRILPSALDRTYLTSCVNTAIWRLLPVAAHFLVLAVDLTPIAAQPGIPLLAICDPKEV